MNKNEDAPNPFMVLQEHKVQEQEGIKGGGAAILSPAIRFDRYCNQRGPTSQLKSTSGITPR